MMMISPFCIIDDHPAQKNEIVYDQFVFLLKQILMTVTWLQIENDLSSESSDWNK